MLRAFGAVNVHLTFLGGPSPVEVFLPCTHRVPCPFLPWDSSALDLQSACEVSLIWKVPEKHCSKEDVFVCAHSKVLVSGIKLFVA